MVSPAAGAVVLVRFPFSDLSRTKLRPAVVLADVRRGDFILCQITSNPYGDATAIELAHAAFAKGSLRVIGFARPAKLFTANQNLIVSHVGDLQVERLRSITQAVPKILDVGKAI